jgi:hypothetical protein
MPIVGSFAGASARAYGLSAGVQIGDFESIATVTAGSAVSSLDFTSIPQTYSHLQIRGIGRNSVANADDNISMQFNSDTAANYSLHYISGSGASASAGAATGQSSMIILRVPGSTSSANMFGPGVVDILDYANTNKFKTIRSITGHDQNGSGSVWLFSGNWRSTSAITSIKIFYSGNTLAQNTTFALYGVKA